jgi:hypothetical protein
MGRDPRSSSNSSVRRAGWTAIRSGKSWTTIKDGLHRTDKHMRYGSQATTVAKAWFGRTVTLSEKEAARIYKWHKAAGVLPPRRERPDTS